MTKLMKYEELKDYNFNIKSFSGKEAMGIRRKNLLPERLSMFRGDED
jgi:hypothetical protein